MVEQDLLLHKMLLSRTLGMHNTSIFHARRKKYFHLSTVSQASFSVCNIICHPASAILHKQLRTWCKHARCFPKANEVPSNFDRWVALLKESDKLLNNLHFGQGRGPIGGTHFQSLGSYVLSGEVEREQQQDEGGGFSLGTVLDGGEPSARPVA